MTGPGGGPGILLTVAPAAEIAADLPTLMRVALDAEQVGAGRLHLPADLPDPQGAVRELRDRTGLVLTCDPGGTVAQLCDLPGPSFVDVVIEPADPADLLTTIAALAVDGRRDGRRISVSGRGSAALPVALAAVAGGLHLRVGTSDEPVDELPAAPGPPSARRDVALIARAAGLARIAGRPAIRGAAAADLMAITGPQGSGHPTPVGITPVDPGPGDRSAR